MAPLAGRTSSRTQGWRLAVAAAALMSTGAVDRIEFPPQVTATRPEPPGKREGVPQQSPQAETTMLGTTQAGTSEGSAARTRLAVLPVPQRGTSGTTDLEIAQWGFTNSLPGGRYPAASNTAVHGGPVYLWIKVKGGHAAVDRLRGEGRLAIEVHWNRDGGDTSAGPHDHVAELPIGRRELGSTFAEQVKRYGFFEWHSWARRDALGHGRWTVSLTYPDGQPVLCEAAQPCRFSLKVG